MMSRPAINDNSDEEDNIIRVKAEDLLSQDNDISHDSKMDSEEGSNQEYQNENERKSNDQDHSQSDSASNVLRRSERMAKNNNQGSYRTFNRRSFKYDDEFEYTI